MTTRVIVLRPRFVPSSRPRPAARPGSSSSSRPSVPSSSSFRVPVTVEWDGVRGLHVARCVRCAECFTSSRVDLVEDWAATHRCDAELAALLANIVGGRAA